MHNISIPVNGNKLPDRKHNFLEKSVEGCTSYDVIALWSDLIWLKKCKSCAKNAPLAEQNFSTIQPAVRRPFQKKKLMRSCIPPARARANTSTILLIFKRNSRGVKNRNPQCEVVGFSFHVSLSENQYLNWCFEHRTLFYVQACSLFIIRAARISTKTTSEVIKYLPPAKLQPAWETQCGAALAHWESYTAYLRIYKVGISHILA